MSHRSARYSDYVPAPDAIDSACEALNCGWIGVTPSQFAINHNGFPIGFVYTNWKAERPDGRATFHANSPQAILALLTTFYSPAPAKALEGPGRPVKALTEGKVTNVPALRK